MNYFALIPLITSIIFLIFAIINFNKNRESILFFIFLNLLAISNFIFFNIIQANDLEVIQFWEKLSPIWLLMLPIFLHYLFCFTDKEKYLGSKIILNITYIIAVALMALEFNSLIDYFNNLKGNFHSSYQQFSSSSIFYSKRIFSSIFFLAIIILSYYLYKRENNSIKKNLLKYLLVASSVIFFFNLLPFVIDSYDMDLFYLQFSMALMPFIYISHLQKKYTFEKRFISNIFKDFHVHEDEFAIIFNNKNEIIFVNQFFLNTLGYKEKEIIGEDINSLLKFNVEFKLESDDVNKFNISLKSYDDIFLKFIVNVVNFKDRNNNYIYTLLIGHSHGEKDKQKYLNICSYCKNVKISGTRWVKFEEYLADNYNIEFTHGICSDCYKVIVHKYKNESD